MRPRIEGWRKGRMGKNLGLLPLRIDHIEKMLGIRLGRGVAERGVAKDAVEQLLGLLGLALFEGKVEIRVSPFIGCIIEVHLDAIAAEVDLITDEILALIMYLREVFKELLRILRYNTLKVRLLSHLVLLGTAKKEK